MNADSTTASARSLQGLFGALALAALLGLLLARLPSYGIWDPWEIEVADVARRLAEGETVAAADATGGAWLVSRGFAALGVDEWTGRLPIALSGAALIGLCFALVALLADRRTATYAALIAGSSPLLVLNARTMLGEAPIFALQTAIVVCGSAAVLGRPAAKGARVALLLGTLVLLALSLLARGALLGAIAPLAAVAVLAAAEGKLDARGGDRVGFAAAVLLWGLLLGLALTLTERIALDRGGFDVFRGGSPTGGQPPGFDAVFERTFHAFAPWSGLLPLALARLLMAPSPDTDTDTGAGTDADQLGERRLRMLSLTWLGVGYVALTLYLSRYGQRAAVLPLCALAIPVALLLRDVERQTSARWALSLCAALGIGLLLRDYALYPSAPMHAVPVADASVPEVFDPRRAWTLALGAFGAVALLAFGTGVDAGAGLDLRAPYRVLGAQWARGFAFKAWLLGAALVLLALIAFGAVSWVAPKALRLSSLGIRAGKVMLFVPFALPLAVGAVQLAIHGYGRLGRHRVAPVLLAGLAVGAYTGHGFMPALSAHFSPREVYDTYNALAMSGEPLIEYRVGSRTAAYYAKGDSLEAESTSALIDQLASPERRWAVFAADELAALDRMFRARVGRHLFVADARSAKVVLATNLAVKGRRDQSFLSTNVLSAAPARIQHPTKISFEDKIDLLGYDLKLPQRDQVGAGQRFAITWYWKARKSVPGSYKVFLHIDNASQRIHGDHDPVDGKYPVRLWDEADVIVDRHELEVPANYPPGDYVMWVGFYSGEDRLEVTEGPEDEVNRARAGVLRIR